MSECRMLSHHICTDLVIDGKSSMMVHASTDMLDIDTLDEEILYQPWRRYDLVPPECQLAISTGAPGIDLFATSSIQTLMCASHLYIYIIGANESC